MRRQRVVIIGLMTLNRPTVYNIVEGLITIHSHLYCTAPCILLSCIHHQKWHMRVWVDAMQKLTINDAINQYFSFVIIAFYSMLHFS